MATQTSALKQPAAPSAWQQRVDDACAQACAAIAPAWPLDRAIAVNPHWQRINRPIRQVAARMAVLGDIQVLPSRSYIKHAWQTGRISPADLRCALTQASQGNHHLSDRHCIEALSRPLEIAHLPLLIDVLDDDPERFSRLSWREAITHQVSQTCAAYFDNDQADWQPSRTEGLYAFWRDTLTHDHGIGVLMGLPQIGKSLDKLPATRQDAEYWAMARLGLDESVWADYLESVLLTVNGWASWCAYLGWQAGLAGQQDAHLGDLLAIRLAWGTILLDCKEGVATKRAFEALQNGWHHAQQMFEQTENLLLVDEIWQIALEVGYQRQLAASLKKPSASTAEAAPIIVQAAFCIDVRSERFRRALETVSTSTQTLGVAGFFGLPIAYTPLATSASRPQLPGLLAPAMQVQDEVTHAEVGSTASAFRARRRRFAWANQLDAASRWPSAAFSFVEAAGLAYLGKLATWIAPGKQSRDNLDLAGLPKRYRDISRPTLVNLSLDSKINLATGILHAMGLERFVAPFVLLVGHGSQTTNNAQAAALDCGACCGQTGEVNARALAALLNEAAVREGLKAKGWQIPTDTAFIAALHNTTTDEIEGFDLELLTPATRIRWQNTVAPMLVDAGDLVRRERADSLGINTSVQAAQLLQRFRRRGNDGTQTRPEWGLANNAAFIIAPRQHTREAMLDGRSFLHDYDASLDQDGSLLELLITAPMLVTHWINWQYHASTCDPARMGSGNKLLHNVVGGHIGVFEGNGGDLRIGLSSQSLHNGEHWMHEPLRLTVIIDAPQNRIESIIAKHSVVQQLLNHQWLHLWRYEGQKLVRYVNGEWLALDFDAD